MALKDRYINPFTDFGFKKLFGSEPNKDLLIDFLNEVVLPSERKIQDLSYKKNEHIGESEFDRKAIFDLYCIGSNGERFIVEMQKAKQNYFKDRSVYYSTFPIQEQALRGDWDYKLTEVFTVGILDFVFTDDKTEAGEATDALEVRHIVKLKNQVNQVFYDKLTFIYLEMPNFTKKEEELVTTYDKWLYVLKNLHKLQNRPQKLQEKVFEHLFSTAEIAQFSSVEKEQYEESLKYYRDLKNVVDTSYFDGFHEGIEKGFHEGKEEGFHEGKEEGFHEAIANGIINALKRGRLTVEEIAEDFGVSVEFVLEIKRKMTE